MLLHNVTGSAKKKEKKIFKKRNQLNICDPLSENPPF